MMKKGVALGILAILALSAKALSKTKSPPADGKGPSSSSGGRTSPPTGSSWEYGLAPKNMLPRPLIDDKYLPIYADSETGIPNRILFNGPDFPLLPGDYGELVEIMQNAMIVRFPAIAEFLDFRPTTFFDSKTASYLEGVGLNPKRITKSEFVRFLTPSHTKLTEYLLEYNLTYNLAEYYPELLSKFST